MPATERKLMKPMKTLVVAMVLALHAGAWAHGDQAHGQATDPPRKEQKDWGIAGDAQSVRRTIHVGMSDAMRFTPESITVRRGETVRFVFRNDGRLLHEFVIGTKPELEAHAALMAKFPDMEHDEPYMAHVPAGKTGEIVWTFNRPGRFEFACLIAGHFQAGMVGRITVSAK
ncbi:MAG: cupredoxin family protein [Piscinibacter sp.]